MSTSTVLRDTGPTQPGWSEPCFRCNGRGVFYFTCPNSNCTGPPGIERQQGATRQIMLCSRCQGECPFCQQASAPEDLRSISEDTSSMATTLPSRSGYGSSGTTTLTWSETPTDNQPYHNMSHDRLIRELEARDLKIAQLKKKYEAEKSTRIALQRTRINLESQLEELQVFSDIPSFDEATRFGGTVDRMCHVTGDTGHLPNTYPGPVVIEHLPDRRHGRLQAISRALACILRHQADLRGIQVRSDGFVEVDRVLVYLRRQRRFQTVTVDDVEEVVANSVHEESRRMRFELWNDESSELLIRACDMHTIPGVDVTNFHPARPLVANPRAQGRDFHNVPVADVPCIRPCSPSTANSQTESTASYTHGAGDGGPTRSYLNSASHIDSEGDGDPTRSYVANPQTGSPASRIDQEGPMIELLGELGQSLADFDGTTDYGEIYLTLREGEEVYLLQHDEAGEDWVYGVKRSVSAEGTRHESRGWLPRTYWAPL